MSKFWRSKLVNSFLYDYFRLQIYSEKGENTSKFYTKKHDFKLNAFIGVVYYTAICRTFQTQPSKVFPKKVSYSLSKKILV